MAIQTILVPLFGNAGDARCLGVAAEVARRTQAHINALFCDSDPIDALAPIAGEQGGSFLSDTLIKSLQERAEARREAAEWNFSDWLSGSGIPFAVSPSASPAAGAQLEVAPGRLQNLIRDRAVVTDLVISPLVEQDDSERSAVLETALFETGRPVLGVSSVSTTSIFAAPVAVAWNYSSEAARALTAALPLIALVGEVAVLMAGRHEDDDAARRVIGYLAWHGVKARVFKLGQTGKPAELVAAKVREVGAGLLVMGAYSHTRAREFVFGGMTSYMLEKAPVPLLLAH